LKSVEHYSWHQQHTNLQPVSRQCHSHSWHCFCLQNVSTSWLFTPTSTRPTFTVTRNENHRPHIANLPATVITCLVILKLFDSRNLSRLITVILGECNCFALVIYQITIINILKFWWIYNVWICPRLKEVMLICC
jgi:hypothetical protein